MKTTGKKRGRQAAQALGGETFHHLAHGWECVGVTTDHTPLNVVEASVVAHTTLDPSPMRQSEGDIKVVGSKFAPLRVGGSLAVTRAMGDFYLKNRDLSTEPYVRFLPYITCRPSVAHRAIDASDAFIILASDGLWNYTSAREVVGVICKGSQLARVGEELQLPIGDSPGQGARTVLGGEWAGDKDKVKDGAAVVNMAELFVQRALVNAQLHSGTDVDHFNALLPGQEKRELVDDITVMVLTLSR